MEGFDCKEEQCLVVGEALKFIGFSITMGGVGDGTAVYMDQQESVEEILVELGLQYDNTIDPDVEQKRDFE